MQKTASDRFRRSLRRVSLWCQHHRHDAIGEQRVALSRKLLGHYAYYGVTGNFRSLLRYFDKVRQRARKRSPVQSKAGAEEYERRLRTDLLSPSQSTKEVPTFAAYADEFLKTYVLANNKPSERAMKASILKHHLLPVFGLMRNILACLGKMLRYAHERATSGQRGAGCAVR